MEEAGGQEGTRVAETGGPQAVTERVSGKDNSRLSRQRLGTLGGFRKSVTELSEQGRVGGAGRGQAL